MYDVDKIAIELHHARRFLRDMIADGRDAREKNLFEYIQLWVKYHQELLEELEGWDE